jgi:signal transduction histidine kinase
MEVEDNGIGFTSKESKRTFGLQTMKERAESVDGKLDIKSLKGLGTKIICHFPCLQEDQIQEEKFVFTDQM